jgi:hypothetical protein
VLEFAKDRILGVDNLEQHVRNTIGCVSHSEEWELAS